MTLAFGFLKQFTLVSSLIGKKAVERERERLGWKADVSLPHRYSRLSENRAASVRADTNKENIPSSGGSSSGSVGEDTGSSLDSQGGPGGRTERTPKPRRSKHSPTLVQLTDNQDAHAVSHHTSSPHLFSSVLFVTVLAVSLLLFAHSY